MGTYVIGHKNPDSDAICSALGYAEYLRRTRWPEAEAARCGEVNERTQYALEQAGMAPPRLVMDVRPTAGQVARREVVSANVDESFMEVFARMRGPGLRTVPVLDGEGRLAGMLSLQKMVELLLPSPEMDPQAARVVPTSLRRVAQGLGGEIQHGVDLDVERPLLLTVGAQRAAAFGERLAEFPLERTLLVTGNRPTIQRPAIEWGVCALVVTGGYRVDEALLGLARERGVTVISSPHDTATTTILVKCSKRITHAVQGDYVWFEEGAVVEDISARVAESAASLFPVLDGEGRLLGVFSKSDLLKPVRTRLVLVDHNEFSQAVRGVEQADILEVIDHHRLGGNLVSREPIRFINEPLGSTCSIVARMFQEQEMPLDPGMALCLATGIISDTLYLKSPTTTAEDREILRWLEQRSGRDLREYAEAFFAAGSVLAVQTGAQAVRGDCKEYREGAWRFAVSQIEELTHERLGARQAELQGALRELCVERGVDFACLMATDITAHSSVLLVEGRPALVGAVDYPRREDGTFFMEGVVSRKKQLLPHLMRIFQHVKREGE